MSRPRWLPVLVSCLFLVVCADAGPARSEPGRGARETPRSFLDLPGIDARSTLTLRAAQRLAQERVAGRPSCGALFDIGERTGSQVLEQMGLELEDGPICGRGIAATTTVGGSVTRLCRPWLVRLDRRELAVLLIHEALHQAGMSEWPHDPSGRTSLEINQLVAKNCGL